MAILPWAFTDREQSTPISVKTSPARPVGTPMWATGAGSDVMKRIAAPMVGGIVTSFLLELIVYPALYEVWKWHFELKRSLRSA